MPEESIIRYITEMFQGAYTVTNAGNTFFMVDPEGKFPFATLVANDEYDHFSDLNRSSVYRLNIGVSKESFGALFPSQPDSEADGAPSHDFTALNTLMPHPIYGRMHWVCILNPDAEIFERVVQPLLAEAYERDIQKHSRRAAHR